MCACCDRGFPGYLGGANGSTGIPVWSTFQIGRPITHDCCPEFVSPTNEFVDRVQLAPSNAKATANYIADWVECAKTAHNITIDFIGPWNELDKPFAEFGIGYLKTLRATLDQREMQHTKLVGGDVHSWVDSMCDVLNNKTDPELTAAVSVIGKHYPSTQSTAKAQQTGLPLWSSEDYASDNHGAGGRCEARILNQNWIGGIHRPNWQLDNRSFYLISAALKLSRGCGLHCRRDDDGDDRLEFDLFILHMAGLAERRADDST